MRKDQILQRHGNDLSRLPVTPIFVCAVRSAEGMIPHGSAMRLRTTSHEHQGPPSSSTQGKENYHAHAGSKPCATKEWADTLNQAGINRHRDNQVKCCGSVAVYSSTLFKKLNLTLTLKKQPRPLKQLEIQN